MTSRQKSIQVSQTNQQYKRQRKKRRRHRALGFFIALVIILGCLGIGARYFYRHKTMILYRLSALSIVHDQKLSDEVESYRPTIHKYAEAYHITRFENVIAAMMMQESKGQGTDPMQASESPHNRLYKQAPGGIQDPDYSIQIGVKYIAQCLSTAHCTSPSQRNELMLAIQGYNFGDGYINWAQRQSAGYSAANARLFSAQMCKQYGWQQYGDPTYAYKVMTYVNIQKHQKSK